MTVFLAILFVANDWRQLQLQHFSRGMVALFTAINTVSTLLMRAFIRYCLHFVRKKGYNRKYILLVGYSRAAEELYQQDQQQSPMGICGKRNSG